MKKFQQLLSQQSQNEYGLQYRPIKAGKSLLRSIQNSYESKNVQNPETVQVYLKSDQKRCLKMKVSKRSRIQKLKETIQDKLLIPFQDQLIYLNGKQISVFSSITLNAKQIVHIADRKNIIEENESFLISVKVYAPVQESYNGQTYQFRLYGGQKVYQLKKLLLEKDQFRGLEERYSFNFLESGRKLDRDQSFTENLITKNCDIMCLLSQNQVETKFVNQCQQSQISYQRIESPNKNPTRTILQTIKNPKANDHLLNFKKTRLNSKQFMVQKEKPNIYTKISKSYVKDGSQLVQPYPNKHKSQTDLFVVPSGFKKKKSYQDEYQSDDSHLMKKIVVHKSRQQIEKIALENSLIKEQVYQVQEEKKSIVSSSSSEQNAKQYAPVRQQKEYRPCPLIPQRKMAPSEKIKINMELQKLFGGNHELMTNNFAISQSEGKQQRNPPQLQVQTTKSRVVIKNKNLRNSISAKQSMLRIIKDKRPDRYAEEHMYEGD